MAIQYGDAEHIAKTIMESLSEYNRVIEYSCFRYRYILINRVSLISQKNCCTTYCYKTLLIISKHTVYDGEGTPLENTKTTLLREIVETAVVHYFVQVLPYYDLTEDMMRSLRRIKVKFDAGLQHLIPKLEEYERLHDADLRDARYVLQLVSNEKAMECGGGAGFLEQESYTAPAWSALQFVYTTELLCHRTP